jgi:hypothetical protein
VFLPTVISLALGTILLGMLVESGSMWIKAEIRGSLILRAKYLQLRCC